MFRSHAVAANAEKRSSRDDIDFPELKQDPMESEIALPNEDQNSCFVPPVLRRSNEMLVNKILVDDDVCR
jgi:hypothetical protein